MGLRQIQTLLHGLTKPAKPARGAPPLKGPDRRPALLAMHDGLNQFVAGDAAIAVETFQRSYILYRQAGDKYAASLTQNIIGAAFDAIEETVLARKAFEKAIRLLQIAEMPDEVGRLLTRLARFESAAGNHAAAIEALRRAIATFREIGNATGLAETLCQFAEHEIELGRRTEAHAHGLEAKVLLERIDDVNTYEKLSGRVGRLMAA